jgi:hypothetical protein
MARQRIRKKSAGVGDVFAQAERAMKNIKVLLTDAGSSFQRIRQNYDLHHRPALPGGRRTRGRSTSQMHLSNRPECLVETIAIVPD